MIDVEFKTSQLRRLERDLGAYKSLASLGVSRALNKTAKTVQTRIANEAGKRLMMRKRDIKKRIKISPRAYPARLFTKVRMSPRRIPLIFFGNPRQVRAGVSYRISRGGGRSVAKGAFLMEMPFGMAVRKRVGKSRLPTMGIRGPSVAHVVGSADRIISPEYVGATLKKFVDAQVEVLISQAKARERGRARR